MGGAQRRGAQETLVVPQTRYLQELPEVTLQVRRHIGAEKAFRIDLRIPVELRESAANQELLDAEMRMRRPGFGEGEWLQLDDLGTPRQ